jgi:hypothetical protein
MKDQIRKRIKEKKAELEAYGAPLSGDPASQVHTPILFRKFLGNVSLKGAL